MTALIGVTPPDSNNNNGPKNQRPTLNYQVVNGLDFLLSHFKQGSIFPRNISTKLTGNKQKPVYNRTEALEYFAEAELKDCKIAAYHSTDWRKGLSRVIAPDLLFIDLDLGVLRSMIASAAALDATLTNIKSKLGGVPSVIWSGNGYHIYQPVEAFILEQQQIFSKFKQPSRRLLQFAERYLSNGKMDKCHNKTMSLHNCMLRVPGSYNSKSETPKKVEIVQRWDGNRPDIKPLLYRYYLYMQDRRLMDIRKQQQDQDQDNNNHWHSNGKFCSYWRKR